MPDRLRTFAILQFFLSLLFLIYNLISDLDSNFDINNVIKESYECEPLISFEKLALNARKFKKLTCFEPIVFIEKVVKPMIPFVEVPRNYYFNINHSNININNANQNGRKCALDTTNRIFRWYLLLRGAKLSLIVEIFDQDGSVAIRDFVHCCFACCHALGPVYLKRLNPFSEECNLLKGKYIFRYFRNVFLAGDVTKVCLFAVFVFFTCLHVCLFAISSLLVCEFGNVCINCLFQLFAMFVYFVCLQIAQLVNLNTN